MTCTRIPFSKTSATMQSRAMGGLGKVTMKGSAESRLPLVVDILMIFDGLVVLVKDLVLV